MTIIKQAVLLGGGLGTRLRPITYLRPKPLVNINGKPFLGYLMDLLKENNIKEFVILLTSKKIESYVKNGSKFGLKIKYKYFNQEINNGKKLKDAYEILDNEFLLLYNDNYYPFKLKPLAEFHKEKALLGTCTVYSNKDGFTKNNVFVDDKGVVRKYDSDRIAKRLNGVEIGFSIINKEALNLMPNTDFSISDFLKKLCLKKELAAFVTDQRYCSIGNLERLPLTRDYLSNRKILFLDRDGVINRKPKKSDYVKTWNEFNFLPGSLEAIKLLTKKKYEIYVITNQAGIGRGLMKEEELHQIHYNMASEIEKSGGKIVSVYYCPHKWDEGCDCRKPRPGMIFQAQRDNNLNLKDAIFIGDEKTDREAGIAAGIKTIILNKTKNFLKVARTLK